MFIEPTKLYLKCIKLYILNEMYILCCELTQEVDLLCNLLGEKAIESWFMKREMFRFKTPILIISLTYEKWYLFKRRVLEKACFHLTCIGMDYVSFLADFTIINVF